MAATLIRLKLRLMANDFGRSLWIILGTALVLIYGLGMATIFLVIQIRMGDGNESFQNVLSMSVLLGAAAFLFWILIPVFVAGGDALMDPRRFVTFAVPRRSLILGLILSAMISVGSVITVVWLIGQVMLWRWDLGALAVALLSLPLLLIT